MKSIRDRYLTDATFHAVVTSMRALISGAQLTPSEVREAAMLACIIEEEHRPFNPASVYESGLCCMARHASDQRRGGSAPPCNCPCHEIKS